MQWLLAAMRRHQRRLRIENWLILLLRIAAVLLLGLALARPVLTDPDLAGLLEGKRSVYLGVDTSYSMAARVRRPVRVGAGRGRGGRGAVRPRAARTPSRSSSPTTSAKPQSDGRAPYALLPRTVGEDGATRARERVASLRTRDAPASWAETLARVRQQMADEDVNRVVVIITDLQARDWRDERVTEALTDLLRARQPSASIDVGGSERRNLTVAEPGHGVGARRVRRAPAAARRDDREPGRAARRTARGSACSSTATRRPIRSLRVPTLEPVDDATGKPGAPHAVAGPARPRLPAAGLPRDPRRGGPAARRHRRRRAGPRQPPQASRCASVTASASSRGPGRAARPASAPRPTSAACSSGGRSTSGANAYASAARSTSSGP